MRAVVVHGHYYQPPREDPWLEVVAAEANAAPFHDWNARIERECYRAVVAARVPAADGRIARIVNALSWTSFDFGPTPIALPKDGPALAPSPGVEASATPAEPAAASERRQPSGLYSGHSDQWIR